MQTSIIFFVLFPLISFISYTVSQDVCEGDIRSISDSDINTFSHCVELKGSLTLYNTTLTSLKPLTNLQIVHGDVYLYSNNELISLKGLESLNTIKGNLDLLNNPVLSTLKNMKSLSKLGGRFTIWDNPLLKDLDGLQHLTELHSDFDILFNKNLTSLNGLQGLRRINGHLKLQGNDKLNDLTALNALINIGSDLEIAYNARLKGFKGLINLQNVGGRINIQHINNDKTDSDNCLPKYLSSRITDWSQFVLRDEMKVCDVLHRFDESDESSPELQTPSVDEDIKSAGIIGHGSEL